MGENAKIERDSSDIMSVKLEARSDVIDYFALNTNEREQQILLLSLVCRAALNL